MPSKPFQYLHLIFCLFVLMACTIKPVTSENRSDSAPELTATSFVSFDGTELALQGFHVFKEFGAQNMVGVFVALAGVREMAPILVTGMIAAKAGSSITTSLAVMRNTEQIDALEVMAVDPVEHLIAPRFLGAVLAVPALTSIANFVTLASAYLVAVHQLGVEPAFFIGNIVDYLEPYDLGIGMLKAVAMGVVIWVLSCYFGFSAAPGPEGVGRAANQAIVSEVVVAVLVTLLITSLAY